MGLSLTQLVTLLAIILPRGAVPSRATVGRWVQQAGEQASRILSVLDRSGLPDLGVAVVSGRNLLSSRAAFDGG
jgi:hypothetical protein